MTRVWDEKLEGTGYEETWNFGETVTAGNTLDEDQATSGVTGAPANWGAQCLKAEAIAGGTAAYIYHSEDFGGTLYFRVAVIVSAETLANDETFAVASYFDSTFVGGVFLQLNQDSNGDLEWLMVIYTDSTSGFQVFGSFELISLDTPYVLEFMVDESAGAAGEWDWWIDGVRQANDQDATDPVTTPGNLGAGFLRPTELLEGIVASVGSGTNTIYIDNIAMDDARRVGTGPVLFRPPLAPYRHNLVR